ncbi:SMI1/KNR4 family protein [Phytomonospora sp. NPDC050363]|uniref:SMI1/KNR4 family protein n=1 Tax=Phytomonospora sp. NPDC050363 TaxID=3155642 RepID=UPI0033F0E9F3
MDETLRRIGAKLALLPDLHGRRESHGEQGHRLRVAPLVPEGDIADFEARHGVKLPEGYRRFLTEVSGGGVGPGYGLSTLSSNDHPSCDYATESAVRDGNPDVAAWLRAFGEDDDPWAGTIEIAYHGCADFTRLVLTGPERGRVFCANRDAEDCTFAADDFLDWYETWLDTTTRVEDASRRTAHPGDEAELIAAFTDAPDRTSRFRAAWTLATLPELTAPGRAAVVAATGSPERAVRALAIALVGHLGIDDAAEVARGMLSDPDSIVRSAARRVQSTVDRDALDHGF